MRVNIFITILLYIILHFSALAKSEQEDVVIVTEELPPLQVVNQNGQPSGAMVELIELALAESELSGRVNIYPWARSYQLALTRPNTLIFSMIRTPSRETQFTWVDEIFKANVHLIKLANRPLPELENLAQALNYRIGVTRNGLAHEYLGERGFIEGKNMMLNSTYTSLWAALTNEKVDFILANELKWLEREAEKGKSSLPLALALPLEDFGKGYYLAAHPSTAPKIIEKLQKALAKLKQNGQYQAILDKWQLND